MKSINFALDAMDLRLADHLNTVVLENKWRTGTPEDQSLAQCGLMTFKVTLDSRVPQQNSSPSPRTTVVASAELRYGISELGKLFVEICLK